jgi:ribosomal protein S19E (S16A)
VNERIKELCLQFGNRTGNSVLKNASIFEEFSQVIVRECCQKLENDGMVEVAMEMKQHFGVKS